MIKFITVIIFLSVVTATSARQEGAVQTGENGIDTIPARLIGNFTDDYDITYTITDTLWTQHSNIRYHILKWNTKEQYIIARNHAGNPNEAGLYTRIDYMFFDNMKPWRWGFCLTVYNEKSDSLAEAAAAADRENPRKGCNGFPFSRMKKTD